MSQQAQAILEALKQKPALFREMRELMQVPAPVSDPVTEIIQKGNPDFETYQRLEQFLKKARVVQEWEWSIHHQAYNRKSVHEICVASIKPTIIENNTITRIDSWFADATGEMELVAQMAVPYEHARNAPIKAHVEYIKAIEIAKKNLDRMLAEAGWSFEDGFQNNT